MTNLADVSYFGYKLRWFHFSLLLSNPLSFSVAPKIAPFVLQNDLHVGDRVGVQCFVTKGDLPLWLSWTKDGRSLPNDVIIRQYGVYTSSLTINSLTEGHSGNYTCIARNNASSAEFMAELLVNGNL